MEQRISVITLGVIDLKRSRAFYAALGWSGATQSSVEIAMYNLHASAFALYQRNDLAADAEVPLSSGMGHHPPFTLAYNAASTKDVDKILSQAQLAGGKSIKPAQKASWGGYSGYFADPDGFLWEVAHNPFSPLGPKNEFNWGGFPVK